MRRWPISSLRPSSDDSDEDTDDLDSDDAYASDSSRMYEFKVRRSARGRSHDWTECPFAHPGEKARHRDPRRFHYSAEICPDFRRSGSCRLGDACELSHGVFECWLHPARYRTQPCKDGRDCKRKICFFAHTPRQLRVLPLRSSITADSRAVLDDCILCAAAAANLSHASPPISPPLSPPESYSPISYHRETSTVDLRRLSSLDFLLTGVSYNQTMVTNLVGSVKCVDLAPCSGKQFSAMKACSEERERDGTGPDLEWVNELLM
ncbi:zinc finger CCCH domain-containing protein 2-like [Magnolia sinica]|uniref:zinc finger CCCH domain-containing protein 2-like n=1 Tax=Magnolia sinica TaxID=86752 RepID=UPI0026580437|nr:zinc finger CCCH domain-containing protein 2-like [Magnolia sinica]